jgi:hypothetical protein
MVVSCAWLHDRATITKGFSMAPETFASWLRPGWNITVGDLPGMRSAILWRPAGERPSQGFRVIAEHDLADHAELAGWETALDALTATGELWKPRAAVAFWMLPNPPPGFEAAALLGPE